MHIWRLWNWKNYYYQATQSVFIKVQNSLKFSSYSLKLILFSINPTFRN